MLHMDAPMSPWSENSQRKQLFQHAEDLNHCSLQWLGSFSSNLSRIDHEVSGMFCYASSQICIYSKHGRRLRSKSPYMPRVQLVQGARLARGNIPWSLGSVWEVFSKTILKNGFWKLLFDVLINKSLLENLKYF